MTDYRKTVLLLKADGTFANSSEIQRPVREIGNRHVFELKLTGAEDAAGAADEYKGGDETELRFKPEGVSEVTQVRVWYEIAPATNVLASFEWVQDAVTKELVLSNPAVAFNTMDKVIVEVEGVGADTLTV